MHRHAKPVNSTPRIPAYELRLVSCQGTTQSSSSSYHREAVTVCWRVKSYNGKIPDFTRDLSVVWHKIVHFFMEGDLLFGRLCRHMMRCITVHKSIESIPPKRLSSIPESCITWLALCCLTRLYQQAAPFAQHTSELHQSHNQQAIPIPWFWPYVPLLEKWHSHKSLDLPR